MGATSTTLFLVPVDNDLRKSNQRMSGANLVILSIADYLAAVPYEIRPSNMEVTIVTPVGTYSAAQLATNRKNFAAKKYQFGADPTDGSFAEVKDAISAAAADANNKVNNAVTTLNQAILSSATATKQAAVEEAKSDTIVYLNTTRKKVAAKWGTLGSSSTEGYGGYLYQTYVQNYFEFSSFLNYGVGGTVLDYAVTNVIPSWSGVIPDIISIMYGANDWANNVTIGVLQDFIDGTYDTSKTFYSTFRRVLDLIYAKNANALVYLVTLYPRRLGGDNATNRVNTGGKYMYQFNDAIREIGKFAGIPVIDVERDSNVNMFNILTMDYLDDGIHVQELGKRRIAQVFIDKFSGTIPSNMYIEQTIRSSAKDITSFSISGVSGSISGTNISLSVPVGTVLSSLTPVVQVSAGATISPASGASTDFTNPVAFTVTAQDGSIKVYTVIVSIGSSSAKDITSFSINGVAGSINSNTILLTLPYGTALTSLTPIISASSYATVSPASGSSTDFTSPVAFTVTAQDGTAKTYIVTVALAAASSAKDITAFSINGVAGSISGTNIGVTMPYGASLLALIPMITISAGATISPLSAIATNFTNPVAFTVTAQDGSVKVYTVTVTTATDAYGVNIYDPTTMYVVNKALGTSGGIDGSADSTKDLIGYVPIEPGKTYKIDVQNTTSGLKFNPVLLFRSSKLSTAFIGGYTNGSYIVSTNFSANSYSFTTLVTECMFTAPAGAIWMVLYGRRDATPMSSVKDWLRIREVL